MGRTIATKKKNIIILLDEGDDEPKDLLAAIKDAGKVIRAASVEQALEQVDLSARDWVVLDARRLAEATGARMAVPSARILDVIDQGACLLKPDGELLWANKLFRSLPVEVITRVTDTCRRAFIHLDGHHHVRPRKFSFHVDDEQYYDLVTTPIVDNDEAMTHLAGIITNSTQARRLQQKIYTIDQVGRELMQLDAQQFARLDVQQRLDWIENKVSRYTSDLMHFENYSIWLLDRKTNRLELVLNVGLPEETKDVDIYASPDGNGISGYVAATGRSYICPDCAEDPRYLFGMENAGSSLTVALKLHDKIIGIFNVESTRTGAFTEDDRQYAEIFARYLAVALNILDLMVVERSTTTGQLADNVSSEIAGPLNDIFSDATTLMEDYVGQEDLLARLRSIIANAGTIRDSIKEVSHPASGMLGSRSARTTEDPALKDKRILVADDDQTIRETIRDVLTGLGCAVETARDGAEAAAMIDQRSYDLVLSDIKMPYHNGYEIFSMTKNADPDCPVILMTGFGYDPHHSVIRSRQEGLAAVLFKPFKIEQFLEELRRAIITEPTDPSTPPI